MTDEPPPRKPMPEAILLRAAFPMVSEAIASVALSHPATCDCLTCRAAGGDVYALARVIAELEDRQR